MRRPVALAGTVGALAALAVGVVPAGGQGAGAASSLTLNKVSYDPASGPTPGCNAPLPSGGTGSFTYDDPGGGYKQTWEWSLPSTITSGVANQATIKVTGQTFNNGGLTTSMTLQPPGGLGTNAGARTQVDAVVPAGAPGTDTESETHTYTPTRAFAEGEKVYIRVGIGCVGYLHEYIGHAAPTTTTTTSTTTPPPTCGARGFRQSCPTGDSATVSGVSRKVELQLDQGAWTPGANGMKLKKGDRIHTGFKAGVVITFPDGSRLAIAPMSLVELGDISAGPQGVKARVHLRLGEVAGEVIKSAGSAADFQIKTPTSTASIRGTKFSVGYDGNATTVKVTESSVAVTANNGVTQLVSAGQETRSTATTVARPVPIGKGFRSGGLTSAQALARVTAVLSPRLTRCRLTPLSTSLAPAPGGWKARLPLVGATQGIAARLRGTASFRLKGRRFTAGNPLGKRVLRGCAKR